jgi:hypothetical protein
MESEANAWISGNYENRPLSDLSYEKRLKRDGI